MAKNVKIICDDPTFLKLDEAIKEACEAKSMDQIRTESLRLIIYGIFCHDNHALADKALKALYEEHEHLSPDTVIKGSGWYLIELPTQTQAKNHFGKTMGIMYPKLGFDSISDRWVRECNPDFKKGCVIVGKEEDILGLKSSGAGFWVAGAFDDEQINELKKILMKVKRRWADKGSMDVTLKNNLSKLSDIIANTVEWQEGW